MRPRATCLLVLAFLAPAIVLTAQAQAPALDPELEAGIRKVDEGNFEAGITTLDAVVRRLKAAGDQPRQLSRAYLYLGIAHLQLSHEQAARARFAEAAKSDTTLKLSEYEFPPRVIDVFEEAKKGAALEALPEPTPEPKVVTEPPTGPKLPPGPFLEAVKAGDFVEAQRQLSEDPTLVAVRDSQFDATPLHWAALRGQAAVAGLLVASGADLSARNRAGETAEQVARRGKHAELAAILTPRGEAPAGATAGSVAAVGGGTGGKSIFEAAKTGDIPRIREILAASPALVSVPDTAFGATPLHWAALRGHVEAARVLLGQGADPVALNDSGETPREVAHRAKREEVEELLAEVSATPQQRFFEGAREGDTDALSRLLETDESLVEERDARFGATALHWAALRGHAAVAELLLARGADPTARNTAGETPYDVARRAKHEEVERILAGIAATPSQRFFDAVRAGDAAAVSDLLETDGNLIRERDAKFGATGLHWAALRGHAAVAELLLARGADPFARNTAGETPLDVARRARHDDVANLLSQ